VSVGAVPRTSRGTFYFDKSSFYKNAKDLTMALVPIFNKEMKELVKHVRQVPPDRGLGRLAALFTNNKDDYKWIRESIEGSATASTRRSRWHFCFGNAWGNDILSANFPQGYQTVLAVLLEHEGVDEFVLDYANRHMDGVEFLKNCPKDKGVQVGVLDIRTSMVETPDMIADRIRKVIKGGLKPRRSRSPPIAA